LFNCLLSELAIPQPDTFPPIFVACPSGVENSLNQWRAYGQGEGGISLGFHAPLLTKNANKFRAYIVPVIYNSEEKRETLTNLLANATQLYTTHVKNHEDDEDVHLKQWVAAFSIHIAYLAPLMKDAAFAEEQEWRIIYRPEYRTQVKFIPRPAVLSPYVELDVGEENPHPAEWHKDEPARSKALPKRLPLRTVWIGPGRLSPLSKITVNTMLLNYGYHSIEINLSNIAYRIVG
jgi:Protein of unknown function (DUF2971)